MGKKRDERGKEKTGSDRECNLDNGYVSPIRTLGDLSAASIRDTIVHSRYIQILLSLTIIGFLLRFYHLGFNSLWLDEASTYTFASLSIPGIWEATTGGEFNPPLFYWTEHIMLVFGNSEFILRFIPALLGVLTIPVFYLAGKEFADRNTGIIAAAAATFSPFLIIYSQEARAYAMMLFFVGLAMFFCLRALRTNDMKNWALFGAFSALAFWSHFYAMVMVGSLVLYSLYELLPKIQKDIRALRPIVIGGVTFGLLCLPLIPVTLQLFAKRTAGGPTFGFQGAVLIYETFRQILSSPFRFPGSDLVFFILFILFVIGVIQAFRMDRNKGIFLVSITVLTFAISFFLSYRIPMMPRYLIILSLVLFIGIGLSYKPVCSLIANRNIVYGFVLLMLLVSLPFIAGYYSGYTKEDWRGFAGQVTSLTKPGDLVVVAPGYVYQPFDYYYSAAEDGTVEHHADNGKNLESIRLEKGNSSMYIIVTGDIQSANPEGDAVAWLEKNARLQGQNTGIYLFSVN
ncbi:MAG: glycosyl transferase [Methanomicrobiales archaeon]|nr:glycosyl transferase [Methanomicrobiales archaeon]